MSTLFYRRFNLVWPAIHAVREILHTYLKQMKIPSESVDNAGLVLTEYLSNLIRHSEGEDGVMTLVLDSTKGGIKISVIDNTSYFAELANKEEQKTEQIITDGQLREGGMGLALINHMFPDYSYIKNKDKNCFTISLYSQSEKSKIVIVEDEVATLKLLESFLADEYDVYIFDCEYKAQHFLAEHDVEILLIDLNLNCMIATEFISRLARYAHLSKLGIIVLSTDSKVETIKQTALVGIDDYIVKPVEKQALQLVIERVLRKNNKNLRFDNINNFNFNECLVNNSMKLSIFGSACRNDNGDFVITKQRDDNTQIIILVDFMGHGEKASFPAQHLKGFIYGLLNSVDESVTSIVNTLNSAVLSGTCSNNESIFALTILSISDTTIEYINSGQPPLLLQNKITNSIQKIDNKQPLLGFTSDYEYQCVKIPFSKNIRLILYTDGLFENLDKQANDELIIEKINDIASYETDYAEQLWKNTLPELTKEIDDSTLLVLN